MAKQWNPQPMYYSTVWQDLLRQEETRHGVDPTANLRQDRYRAALTDAFRRYLLACYCEQVREQRATAWQPLEGRQAAELVLIETNGWLPNAVADLTEDQLSLALYSTLHQLMLPEGAQMACSADLSFHEAEYLLIPHTPRTDQ